jgi:hypothetical protein
LREWQEVQEVLWTLALKELEMDWEAHKETLLKLKERLLEAGDYL